jgi:dienelactone hydrolase
MDVILHGTNRGMVEVQFMSHTEILSGSMRVPPADFLQIEVLGRTNNAYRWAGETDVLEAVAAAKRSYAVDEKRVVLSGFSMGGSGTWHLGDCSTRIAGWLSNRAPASTRPSGIPDCTICPRTS